MEMDKQDKDDRTLLRAYVRQRSQSAFRDLIERHRRFVYRTCLREIGHADLAEDAAQAVFLILARKASGLQRHGNLNGWLFATAHLASKNVIRTERRRAAHERRAGEALENTRNGSRHESGTGASVNAALARLRGVDREALLLRYGEDLTHAEVGERLGISEEAARKRVDRALGRLKLLIQDQQKAGMSLAVLLLALSGQATDPVPSLAWPPSFGTSLTPIAYGVLRQMQIAQLKTILTGSALFSVAAMSYAFTSHHAIIHRPPLRQTRHPAPVAAIHYQAELIEFGGSGNTSVVSLNDGGQVVGEYWLEGPSPIPGAITLTPHVFSWNSGHVINLGDRVESKIGLRDTEAISVNDQAQILGSGTDFQGRTHLFTWSQGTAKEIPAGHGFRASWLTPNGDVIGSQNLEDRPQAALWSFGQVRDLSDLIPRSESQVTVINRAGQMLIRASETHNALPPDEESYFVSGQNVQRIGQCWAAALDEDGTVGGTFYVKDPVQSRSLGNMEFSSYRAIAQFTWKEGVLTRHPLPNLENLHLEAMNSQGLGVWSSGPSPRSSEELSGAKNLTFFVGTWRGLKPVNQCVRLPSGWRICEIHCINTGGQILAEVTDGRQYQGVLLRPISPSLKK